VKVLVIGGGGREHALAWKLAQSPRVQKVFVAPGNGGTARDPVLDNVDITDSSALADFAHGEKIGLTVVGPEAPLAAGVVDLFRGRGLRIFGPTQAAAQLESSKAFAKDFMQRHGIPPPTTPPSTTRPRRMPSCGSRARRSSSRPTAWPRARAWWWPPRWSRRTRPSTGCWSTTSWASPTTPAARGW
jgi:hypothetical protein